MQETIVVSIKENPFIQPASNPYKWNDWKKYAKAGAVFALTTGACLAAKTTGIFSWVLSVMQSENTQEDALALAHNNEYHFSTFDQQHVTEKNEDVQEIISPAVSAQQPSSFRRRLRLDAKRRQAAHMLKKNMPV